MWGQSQARLGTESDQKWEQGGPCTSTEICQRSRGPKGISVAQLQEGSRRAGSWLWYVTSDHNASGDSSLPLPNCPTPVSQPGHPPGRPRPQSSLRHIYCESLGRHCPSLGSSFSTCKISGTTSKISSVCETHSTSLRTRASRVPFPVRQRGKPPELGRTAGPTRGDVQASNRQQELQLPGGKKVN